MARRARGTFLGVQAGWQDKTAIDQSVLRQIFDSIRSEAALAGCASFPTREDCASHPTLFDEIYGRYKRLTGDGPNRDAFRRHVFAVHKDGGTPEQA